MLVLSRKVGEKIVIDHRVVITVTRISGGRVSVGIEAPNGVHIIRGELKPFDEPSPAANEPGQATLGADVFREAPAAPAMAPTHQVSPPSNYVA
ncbi:MAG: carbon storage regulator [Planctomycetes bacterium]|nr:carbon storage regulator [Planctomycetota bacterium]